MIGDMLAALDRMNTDAAEILDAVTPKPSDATSPRGVAEAHALLADQLDQIDAAIAAAAALTEQLVHLRAKARSKPKLVKAATGRKR